MKIKKFFALLLAMTLCMGAFSVNAYAYVDENAATESQPVQEEAVPEETPEPESAEEPMEALTPDGQSDDCGRQRQPDRCWKAVHHIGEQERQLFLPDY